MSDLSKSPVDAASAFNLEQRPGFLIRRLHQIHVAIFLEECAAFQTTPVQYSVLSALAEHGETDQGELGRAVGIDRTNIADVLRRLAERGLVTRATAPRDQRVRTATLTEEGTSLVAAMNEAARRAHDRTVEALPEVARAQFVAALNLLVEANNDIGRAPYSIR